MKLEPNKQTRLQVGVVGLPADWESVYAPALAKLARRVEVTAVFDVQPDKAANESKSLEAVAVGGLLALAKREDVDAVLVLSTGWMKHHLLSRLAMVAKPVFLGIELPTLDTLEYLHSIVTLNRSIWVPQLAHRFTPATTRLMELLATQLGKPVRIDILVPDENQSWTQSKLAATIDWAFFVLRTTVGVQSSRIDAEGCRIRFRMGGDRTADVFLMKQREGEVLGATVHCESGEALVVSDSEIRWKVTGQELSTEVLADENHAVDTQLAIFLRRAAGGLIPTADLSDLHRCHVAAEKIAAAWF